eukprot:5054230-Prymnesium_polylepis.1
MSVPPSTGPLVGVIDEITVSSTSTALASTAEPSRSCRSLMRWESRQAPVLAPNWKVQLRWGSQPSTMSHETQRLRLHPRMEAQRVELTKLAHLNG